MMRHIKDPVVLSVISAASLQAALSLVNTAVAITVGLATLYYIAKKTRLLGKRDDAEENGDA